MYREVAEKYPNNQAFATRDKQKKYNFVTFHEFYEKGLNLATGLIDLGVKPREHVVLLSDNRLEWILADCGIILTGAADVPRGTDVTDADINYIVPHSDSRIVFVENRTMLEKVQQNRSHLKNVKHLILMDPGESAEGDVIHMNDLIERGRTLREGGDRRVEASIEQIQPDDILTLIYTSGTTGVPKGVMLSHANMISQVRFCPVELSGSDRILSILPVWHVFERMFEMLAISRGVCS